MMFSSHFIANTNSVYSFIENNETTNEISGEKPLPTQNNSNNESNNQTKVKYEVKGYCDYIVDGDTLDVEGVGRIRLVGVDTPERNESGYQEAKDYIKGKCLGKTLYLDIDNKKNKDKYGRILAIVYVNGVNINKELLKLNYAEVLYIPPSEFQKGFGKYN
ncbi:thermonuclease family protein [Methanobrevibacter filiformis]|nr:thermonuclease family protein [Methanobrevibacter filiformis]